jgi:hypothetical protein
MHARGERRGQLLAPQSVHHKKLQYKFHTFALEIQTIFSFEGGPCIMALVYVVPRRDINCRRVKRAAGCHDGAHSPERCKRRSWVARSVDGRCRKRGEERTLKDPPSIRFARFDWSGRRLDARIMQQARRSAPRIGRVCCDVTVQWRRRCADINQAIVA